MTFANRLEYCALAEQFRLHEFDAQAAAMRRGLATVVPMSILQVRAGVGVGGGGGCCFLMLMLLRLGTRSHTPD